MTVDPMSRAGLVLGMGLGGFADGIVLHQILGWHHMICSTEHCRPRSIEHLQRQNVQDGFFHLAVWVITLVGVALLFRAGRDRPAAWSGRVLLGAMLTGWGAFNFVEGLVDHQVLGIHHVLPGHPRQALADGLFLASGLALAALGWLGLRRGGVRPITP